MLGELFVYEERKRLVAFESDPATDADACVVLIAGLTDGLMALPWTERLSVRLARHGLSLVQCLFSSSYRSFGISSLQEDAQELRALLKCLHDRGRQTVFLLGHSTGCQDILQFLGEEGPSEMTGLEERGLPTQSVVFPPRKIGCSHSQPSIGGVILQGGIPDSEYMRRDLANYESLLQWAHEQCEQGQSLKVCSELVLGVPMTAYRLQSLLAPGGDDDYFSEEVLPPQRSRLSCLASTPTLVLFSGADEYVPRPGVIYELLTKAYHMANPSSCRVVTIEGADHAVTVVEHQEQLIDEIIDFVTSQSRAQGLPLGVHPSQDLSSA